MPHEKVMAERELEKPCINFLEEMPNNQHKEGRGYVWEQPWPYAMWKVIDLPGQCTRTDQCRYGATDEESRPILKATGQQDCILTLSCGIHVHFEEDMVENFMLGYRAKAKE